MREENEKSPVNEKVCPKRPVAFRSPETISIKIEDSFAGKIPVIRVEDVADFEDLVTNTAYRGERPDNIDKTGASFIHGNTVRYMILSYKPYSNVPAGVLGLDETEWKEKSMQLRFGHECTHFFTKRSYGISNNIVHDEVMADFIGIYESFGFYKAEWFLRFMGLWGNAGGRIILTMAMCMFVYLISREKSFENCHTTTGYVVKWGILTVISELIFLFGFLFMLIKGESVLAPGWPLRALLAVVACVFVGLFEELTFRVVINDALLYSFRNNKHIFIWIAIISSLVFGSVHVISASIFTDPQALLLAVLKTLSVGIGGFCWLILYWKTRNIWGIALIHGLCDFATFLLPALTGNKSDLGGGESYTGIGATGNVIYLFQIVCSLIALIILWKKVGKTIDFEEIRKNW